MSTTVVIADDHPIVRDGVRFAITRGATDITVAGEAGDGEELLRLAAAVRADVYVVDVSMPRLNGIDATRELVRAQPGALVIVLSLHSSAAVVGEAIRAGARGFVSKESGTRHVVGAIREVRAGRRYLSPDLERPAREANLTPRERRVLQLIAEGLSERQIAQRLDLSINTVHTHRNHLMAKLDIHKQAGLVRFALRHGIAKP